MRLSINSRMLPIFSTMIFLVKLSLKLSFLANLGERVTDFSTYFWIGDLLRMGEIICRKDLVAGLFYSYKIDTLLGVIDCDS